MKFLEQARKAIYVSSVVVTAVLLSIMCLIMAVEVLARYVTGSPLGWNVSLIEKILLPGAVFLALPWAYVDGAHVRAEMLYARSGKTVKKIFDAFGFTSTFVCLVLLALGGIAICSYFLSTGAIPPPLSSQLRIPTWVTYAFLPIGAVSTLVIMVIDLVNRPNRMS
ncbi:TRAP transporter small permease [Brevibacterium paucivorans]|uniref:TRAP transporter small permease n=1 Tax=Brevibacterium paucivorans TaxID=170994 RepID=UPI0032198338